MGCDRLSVWVILCRNEAHLNLAASLSRSHEGVSFMALISAGATAPDFTLDSHLDTTVSLSDFKGSKNVLFVSYPLDFTPT